jgi:hypothetical protein
METSLRLDAPHSSILEPCHSLRHLYIDAPSSCGHASYFFHSITTFAPELTHLRFSGLQQDEWIADHLEVALGLSEPGVSTSKVENLPETMEMILIKPDAQPPLNGHCGTAILRYKQLQRGCRAVQKMDGRVILLWQSTGSDEEGMSTDRLEGRDWLDRVSGGDGCWNASDIEELREREFPYDTGLGA